MVSGFMNGKTVLRVECFIACLAAVDKLPGKMCGFQVVPNMMLHGTGLRTHLTSVGAVRLPLYEVIHVQGRGGAEVGVGGGLD